MKDIEKLSDSKTFPFFHPLSRRFHLMVIIMLLYFSTNYMRTNLGLTMTCMINSTAVKLTAINNKLEKMTPTISKVPTTQQTCGGAVQGDTLVVNDYGGTFDWSTKTQDWIFTATFWGSLFSTLPGGYLLHIISPKSLLGLCTLLIIICTAIFPFLALYTSLFLVFVSRFVLGAGIGPLTPAIDSLIVRWIPEKERGLAVTIYTTGVQVAGFVGIPFTAAVCASAFKWPAVYYITASAAFVMLAVYFLTTTNSPSDVKWMLEEEKEYLQQALGESSPKERPKNIPWFSLLTCVPIMACYTCYFAYGMGQTMLQFYIPIIFKEILFLPIQQNGLYCAVVNIVAIAFKIVWSILMHKLNQKYFSTTTTCIISQIFSLVLSVVCCVLAGHLSNCQQPWISLLLFCGIAMGNGAAMNGFYVSMVSLAPRYTFIISSGGRMCAMLSQLLTPIIVSMFRAEGSLEEWRNIFYVMAAISLFSSIFYVVIGKYDVQEWALAENPQNKIQPKISIVMTEEDLNKKSSEEKSQRLEGA